MQDGCARSESSGYWTAHLTNPISLSLHEAILNDVDFQYIYDYFFDPGKVKGQPYKPLRSPSFTETIIGARRPRPRRSTRDNTGASSVVTELKGRDGHWAAMGGMQTLLR